MIAIDKFDYIKSLINNQLKLTYKTFTKEENYFRIKKIDLYSQEIENDSLISFGAIFLFDQEEIEPMYKSNAIYYAINWIKNKGVFFKINIVGPEEEILVNIELKEKNNIYHFTKNDLLYLKRFFSEVPDSLNNSIDNFLLNKKF